MMILKADYYPHAFLKKRRRYCNGLHPSLCPLCYLLLNHWTKFNQIWCVSYSHEWSVQLQMFFFAPPPGEGSKGQISFNFNYKVYFKGFYTKLCVCSHKCKIQNISDDIFILLPESCPRGGLCGAGSAQGVKKNFKHGHVAYQITGDDKQNRMQVKYSS